MRKIISVLCVIALFFVARAYRDDYRQRAEAKKDAIYWLHSLRGNSQLPRMASERLFHNLEKAHLSLTDLSTNEEEVNTLVRDRYKVLAREDLAKLRKGGDLAWLSADMLKNDVRDAGITLSDLGTSEEEVGQLREKSRNDFDHLIPNPQPRGQMKIVPGNNQHSKPREL